MTLAELARGKPTIDQLDIFARADQLILARNASGRIIGRYFAGQLTELQVKQLYPEKIARSPRT